MKVMLRENYADLESTMQVLVAILTKGHVLVEVSCPFGAGSTAKLVLLYIISLSLSVAP